MGKRAVWVVGACDDNAWERKPLLWQRGEANCLDGKTGTIGVWNGDKQGGFDRRVGSRGPMGDGKTGQAVCNYHDRWPEALNGKLKNRCPFLAKWVVPIAL